MKHSWQDHFKGAIQSAENLYSKDSTEVSLLLFCLRSKLIPVREYLDWARENFQIPVLSEKFFQANKPSVELYKKWQKIYKWSPEIMPLAEWDGVLIIACLEMPANYQNTNPTTFVLASHEVLEQTWAVYSKSQKRAAIPEAPSTSTTTDFTDMTALAATVVAKPTDKNNFFGDNGEVVLQSSSEENAETEIAAEESKESHGEQKGELASEEEAPGSPDGLFGEAPTPRIEHLTNLTKTEPMSLKPMNTEVTKELRIEDVPAESELKPEFKPEQKKGPRTVEPLMRSFEEKTAVDDMPPLDEMEEIHDHEVQFADKKQISPVAQAISGPLPSAPMKPSMNQGTTAAYFLEKVRRQSVDHFDKEVLNSFQQMKTFFKKSMLLAIGDKDRLVKPILWDSNFDVPSPAHSEFNLKTPSIFKIVSGTQKPYHGYVVVNDLNESFFESWNHGQIPDHVTIVPLMDGDHVIGMMMGFGEKASYNKNVLSYTENLTKSLSAKILPASQAKAA